MGKDSTGASVPLPAFIKFVETALSDVPAKPFKIPSGVRFKRVDMATGMAPDDYTSAANIAEEIINPKAPETIQYSQEYKDRFLGGAEGYEYNPGMQDPLGPSSMSVDSGLY